MWDMGDAAASVVLRSQSRPRSRVRDTWRERPWKEVEEVRVCEDEEGI